MMLWFAVALGGAVGAMSRYGVSVALAPQQLKFPVATLTVNVLGSLLMGVFYIIIVEKMLIPQEWRHVIMIGFMGAFTTFSTFSLECLGMLQNGLWQMALLYMGLSLAACLLAIFLGATITDNII